jgi:Mrp family chromosome partitioning ATPase
MEPRDILTVARRYGRLVVACVVSALAVAWVTTPDPAEPGEPAPSDRPVNSFQATHTLIRSSDSIIAGAGIGANASMNLLALLATTGEVPLRVADRLDEENPALLMTSVQVVGDTDLGTIRVTATDPVDGERSAVLANTVADELVAYLAETAQSNQRQLIDDTGIQLQELEDRIEALSADIPSGGDPVLEAQRNALVRQYGAVFERHEQLLGQPPASAGLITLERATPIPIFGSGPVFAAPASRAGRLAAGLAVGLVVGAGVAVGLFRFSTKIRSREESEEGFGLPVVAEVPPLPRALAHSREVAAAVHPHSAVAESYRRVRTAIEHMPSQLLSGPFAVGDERSELAGPQPVVRAHDVVLVTSAGPGEGKTTTVANLAACFAETGQTVAVVAADVHHPELVGMLTDESSTPRDVLAPARGLIATSIAGVWLLPTRELVSDSGPRLTRRGFVADLRRVVDIVLIDSPPLLLSTDAADLAADCDTVLLVARAGRTRTAQAQRSVELLSRLGTPVLGVALIGSKESLVPDDYRYYYAAPSERNGNGHGHGNGNGNVKRHGVTSRPSPTQVTHVTWRPGSDVE